MSYDPDAVAISTGDHKTAALLYSRIIPLHTHRDVPNSVCLRAEDFLGDDREREFFRYLALDEVDQIRLVVATSLPPALGVQIEKELGEKWMGMTYPRDLRNFSVTYLADKLDAAGLAASPLFTSRSEQRRFLRPGKSTALCLAANIPVIDTSAVTWEQVVEFRKDQEAARKLRNFRLFIHANYSGKTQAFIHDDVERRREDYENACRKHGFNLFMGASETIIDGKSLIGVAALSLAAVLTDSNPAVLLGTSAGIALELGRVTLAIAKRSYEFTAYRRNHELAYLFAIDQIKSKCA